MKIEKINENLDYITVGANVQTCVNNTFATAVKDHKSIADKVAKVMAERAKNATAGEREPKTIKNALLKRMFLSESLFETARPAGKQKVHEANDSFMYYETEDGDKWYDMQDFIEDHLSRSDITRPDEQVLTRIARISDVKGIPYRLLSFKQGMIGGKVPLGKYDEDSDEIEVAAEEEGRIAAKNRADKVIEAVQKICDMYKLECEVDKNFSDTAYSYLQKSSWRCVHIRSCFGGRRCK